MAETLWCSGAASAVLHRSRIFAEQIQTPSLSQPPRQPGLTRAGALKVFGTLPKRLTGSLLNSSLPTDL